MAIHHPTPPLGGGERPRLPSAQVGPVTQAIRAMRAADPFEVDPELRAIRDTAERMIADSRAARFRAIQSLRRANAALRSARATLVVGGRA